MTFSFLPKKIIRYRWLVVVFSTLVMLAATAGVPFIGVTNDYRSMFDEANPQLALLDAFEDIYGTSENALIAIAPNDGTVFSRDALVAMEELTDAAWQAPYSIRVDSLTNFAHSSADGDELIVAPLVSDAVFLEESDIERVQQIALNESEIAGRLVSSNGQAAGLVINFALPEDFDDAVAEISDFLDNMLAEARRTHPSINYYLTGNLPLHRTFNQATQDDIQKLGPIVLLVISVISFILLRSLLSTAALVITVIFSANTVMGFAGWFGVIFNPANAGVPVIVLTVAVANSVHIVDTFLDAMRHQGKTRQEAVKASLQANLWPVLLTAVTTIIGFLSLNASESPPFRVMGNLVAFGVFCTFFYSVLLLPALLAVLPIKVKSIGRGEALFFNRFGTFVIAKKRVLLFSSTIVAITLTSGIFLLELTDNWWSFFDDRYQFRRDTDFVNENLTGLGSLEYSLESGDENGITNPVYLKKVETFANWFRSQPEVLHVQSFADIMKRLNMNLHADDPAFKRLPEDPELAAQYLLLYEFSLPAGQDLNNRINVSKSATRLTVTLRNLTAEHQRMLDARAQAWIAENSPGLATEATGFSIAFSHLSQRNIHSMLSGTIIAMGLISLMLIAVFKSVRLGLISLIPNFLPAALSLGLWGYLVGRVGLAGSVMTAFAFGIIVDDTIHFLTRYLKARRHGSTPEEAVRFTFNSTGNALWTTSVVLVAGFLVFATSGFEVSWTLGLLLASTITFAFLADFLCLPPLLMTLDRDRK